MAKATNTLSHFYKRHYEAIALAMQDAHPQEHPLNDSVQARSAWDDVRQAIADLFAGDNGQFQRDRFIRACVPGANVRARS